MISHKYKCIFIHIPRTAGTYIEKLLVGKDYWEIDKRNKHLTASKAKTIYKKYWDKYFKFSFVRHPYTRTESMMRYSNYFFGEEAIKKIRLEHINFYKQKFGFPNTIEFDYRFDKLTNYKHEKYSKNQIYSNILDERIDYIGKYENLDYDLNYIFKRLNFKLWKLKSLFIRNNEKRTDKISTLNDQIKKEIFELYKNDFQKFGYEK